MLRAKTVFPVFRKPAPVSGLPYVSGLPSTRKDHAPENLIKTRNLPLGSRSIRSAPSCEYAGGGVPTRLSSRCGCFEYKIGHTRGPMKDRGSATLVLETLWSYSGV